MFLLYHSEGCNTSETVFHWCYVNDLHTTPCSGMLGHHSWYQSKCFDTRIETLERRPIGLVVSIGSCLAKPNSSYDLRWVFT